MFLIEIDILKNNRKNEHDSDKLKKEDNLNEKTSQAKTYTTIVLLVLSLLYLESSVSVY